MHTYNTEEVQKFIQHVKEMRRLQRRFFMGMRGTPMEQQQAKVILPECKKMEMEVDVQAEMLNTKMFQNHLPF
jgi:GTPase SAR1 family protein